MKQTILLTEGHTEISPSIEKTEISLGNDALGSVRLVASIRSDPTLYSSSERHQEVTTLAIRMDRTVAIELSEQVRALARKMDWPLPK